MPTTPQVLDVPHRRSMPVKRSIRKNQNPWWTWEHTATTAELTVASRNAYELFRIGVSVMEQSGKRIEHFRNDSRYVTRGNGPAPYFLLGSDGHWIGINWSTKDGIWTLWRGSLLHSKELNFNSLDDAVQHVVNSRPCLNPDEWCA